jgi:hypothetical protein
VQDVGKAGRDARSSRFWPASLWRSRGRSVRGGQPPSLPGDRRSPQGRSSHCFSMTFNQIMSIPLGWTRVAGRWKSTDPGLVFEGWQSGSHGGCAGDGAEQPQILPTNTSCFSERRFRCGEEEVRGGRAIDDWWTPGRAPGAVATPRKKSKVLSVLSPLFGGVFSNYNFPPLAPPPPKRPSLRRPEKGDKGRARVYPSLFFGSWAFFPLDKSIR